jgi:M6 family metalloprotease-like protein
VWAPGPVNPDGTVATKSPDYRYVATEGLVFSPNAPQPRDTVPLYGWWSPSRADNLLTTDPSWAGVPGATRSPDYSFVRLEGYVFDKPLGGTRALRRFYNFNSGDNASYANPDWPAGTARAGYTFVRDEGYLLPVAERWDDRTRAEAFGYGRMKVNGKPALGRRPVLLIQSTIPESNTQFEHDTAYYEGLLFGPAPRNAIDYFFEQSHEMFTWKRAGSINVATDRGYGFGTDESWLAHLYTQAIPFDFSVYDTNGDHKITSDELVVVLVNNKSTNGGGSRRIGTSDGCTTPAGSSVALCMTTVVIGENFSFATLCHELAHTLGAEDLYDWTDVYNAGLTLMAYNTDTSIVHLDPWHKMQLGWVRPRIREIHDPAAVESIALPKQSIASGVSDESPLLLYDAKHGMREYFLIEYRQPTTAAGGMYDADVGNYYHYPGGVAIWWIDQDATGDSFIVPHPGGGIDRTVWLFAPNGERGDTHLWGTSASEIALRWFDGSDVGVLLRVGDMVGTNPVAIQWHPTGQPLLPRIDSAHPGTKADVMVVGGMFGLAPTTLTASVGGNSSALGILESTPLQITANPGALPYRTYTLHALTGTSQQSNGFDYAFGR